MIKLMHRFSVIIMFFTFWTTTAVAQEMMFDDLHPTDGAIFIKSVNGVDVPVDIDGSPIQAHPVFRMTAEQRSGNTWAKTVKRMEGTDNGRASDFGPTFNLTYVDIVKSTGFGFDDPVLGAQRRAALEIAFAYYSAVIEDFGEVDMEIRESFSGNPNSNPFAFSASYYFGSKGFNSPFTKSHIVTGSDPYDAYPDAYLQFNFHPNFDYNYDADSEPGSQQFDFHTIVIHEILHVLGFTSYSTASGESAASPLVYTSFDEFLNDYNKDALFQKTGSGSSTDVSIPEGGTLTNNQVWFELDPGQFAPVFAPSPFNPSSLDHFDNGRSETGGYVMHPSLSKGVSFKLLHEHEVRVMEKLGYAVNYSIATAIEEGFSDGAPVRITSGLYPNPAYSSDPVKIDIGDISTNEILVIVYDMLGKQSYSKVILNAGSGPITAIDPYQNLAPGMYIVVGSTKEELFNEKLVIR